MDNVETKSMIKPTSLNLSHSNNQAVDLDKNADSVENGSTDFSNKDSCAMFGELYEHEDETMSLLSATAATWENKFLGITSESVEVKENEDTFQVTDETNIHLDSSTEVSCKGQQKHSYKNEISNRLYCVRSLGWLPMDQESLKPQYSSSAVNSCIRTLSNNRSQIMDAVGVWGEGRDLNLLLTSEHLKIVDPLTESVLQKQSIKHMRVWGVGRDSVHDFAYVVKDSKTKMYKCHVFRCDVPAHNIAKELHVICSALVTNKSNHNQMPPESCAEPDEMLAPSQEMSQKFDVLYMGKCSVSKATGIDVIRKAIQSVQHTQNNDSVEVSVFVSEAAITVKQKNDDAMINLRIRYISFLGVGEDISLFAFISVMSDSGPMCYVFKSANSAKLALAVREACVLRYQKAMDSKPHESEVKSPQKINSDVSVKKRINKMISRFKKNK